MNKACGIKRIRLGCFHHFSTCISSQNVRLYPYLELLLVIKGVGCFDCYDIKMRCLSARQKNFCIAMESINRWLVGCFGFNGPLRQYFSLYRAVSQRAGERGEKG